MKQHFLIIANGPFLSVSHIQKLAKNKIIIALDGAIEKCETINIVPNILLGDFDSISQKAREKWSIFEKEHAENFKLISAEDQSKTDLEKAIVYCDAHNAETIDVVCATDGRMDHTLATLQTLKIHYRDSRKLILHTETENIFFIKNKKINITGKIGDYVGITGFPKAQFTSSGLRYEGDQTAIAFGVTSSFCNQLA